MNKKEAVYDLEIAPLMSQIIEICRRERYCDEFDFRWNHRTVSDGARTVAAIQQADGKRLIYAR